jgi:hypothetical protein
LGVRPLDDVLLGKPTPSEIPAYYAAQDDRFGKIIF